MKLVLLLVLAAALATVALQNQASWEVHFLWLTLNVPSIVLLFLTSAAGFIAGITTALLVKYGAKSRND